MLRAHSNARVDLGVHRSARSNMSDEKQRLVQIADRYRNFAEHQAAGSCGLYETLARSIASSEEVLRFLDTLPAEKQQPNLVLASVRWTCGLASSGSEFRDFVRQRPHEIRSTILTRSTQTNEPARCATLLPVLSKLPQPLALLEVGASAGLCLLPDRYAYAYGSVRLRPDGARDPVPEFPCVLEDGAPAPTRLPEIIWRRGLDVKPIQLSDEEDVAWLQNLVWPSHRERLKRLKRAILVGRRNPPQVVRGDLKTDLGDVMRSAPSNATPVVFHSAVLNYVTDRDARETFGDSVMERGAVWVSNEGPGVFPRIAERVPGEIRPDRFLLAVNGEPVAETGFHGRTFRWLVDPSRSLAAGGSRLPA